LTAHDRGQESGDEERQGHGAYAIGLWGDLPYSPTQATVGVPKLIASMNRQNLAFTVHDGDLKAGSGSPATMRSMCRRLGTSIFSLKLCLAIARPYRRLEFGLLLRHTLPAWVAREHASAWNPPARGERPYR
jgi:hypothetical protein